MSKKKTICIAGKNSIAIKGLKYCLNHYSDKEILFLPHKLDNGEDHWQKSFRKFGIINNVKETNIEDLYNIENLIFISLEYADLILTRKFKSNELFNIHFSLLPKYKGMFTSAHPLINGETKSGVTIHKIDAGIDTGDIIDKISFKISINDTARSLYFKYLKYSFELFIKNIDSIINKKYKTSAQHFRNSSYYSRDSINYKNLKINFNKTAFELHNQFRAYTFREYQIPFFNGWGIIKTKINYKKSNLKPGLIVEENSYYFILSTIDYDIKLIKDHYPYLWKYSIENNYLNLLKSLKYIDNINLRNKNGMNAIILAASNGAYEAADILLKAGANSSSENYQGESALMHAIDYYSRKSDSKIFELLLKHREKYESKKSLEVKLGEYISSKRCEELYNYF